MDLATWCGSGNQQMSCCSRSSSKNDYYSFMPFYNFPLNGSKLPIWSLLWKKIKKEKKKIFDYSTTTIRFTYDPNTYAQNFDEGLTWEDSDEVSRSFSARFAVPSRIFHKSKALMVSSSH
ncbi:hypothetical protein CsSME_00007540 [Camellia sinensis var. sinensis]|uniref:Uncharacterized protein n=1 Tax=Camellia sinensis TaxID=4442 RepID=A0A7J7HY76_CAMSI|nr:hypothetical protein HYC85_004311 [Camellia sinensis]